MPDRAYRLCLYVTSNSPRSARAIVNVRTICDQHLRGRYELEVIDIAARPELARTEQLLAAPTLVKHAPLPVRRFVGDMSRTEQLLRGLGLPAGPPQKTQQKAPQNLPQIAPPRKDPTK